MTRRKPVYSIWMVFSFFLARLTQIADAGDSSNHPDPAKIVGADACIECHAPMGEAWKLTDHFSNFNTMHRHREAREIATNLGLRRIKRDSVCLKCHYTDKPDEQGKLIPVSGVSCEHCHGAARDWINVHNMKNDPDHLIKAEKLGMLRPVNYYEIAANCFACHTAPDEKLVNVGGHRDGSDFELVSWFSGEVRHNLLKSAGKINTDIPIERRRMMYIVGRALDLEYGLRGLAKATEDGVYSQAMLSRIKGAQVWLAQIAKAADLPQVKEILESVHPADLKPGNPNVIDKMATKIGEITSGLARNNNGSRLAGIDALIPGPNAYKGEPYMP